MEPLLRATPTTPDWQAIASQFNVPLGPPGLAATVAGQTAIAAQGAAASAAAQAPTVPPIPSLYNPEAFNELPDAERGTGRIWAYLVEYAPEAANAEEVPLWRFLVNPAVLDFSRSATYTAQPTFAAKIQDHNYYHSTGRTLKIQNVPLYTWFQGKSVRPLIEGLEALLDCKADKYAPPILAFVFGKRRFAPCVLTNVSVQESAWLSGDPATAIVSLDLLEIPKVEARTDASIPEDERKFLEEKPAAKLASPLTERQQADGRSKALEYLRTNLEKQPPEVRELLEKGEYDFAVDKDTGAIRLTTEADKAGRAIGVWDGQKFTPAGASPSPSPSGDTMDG